MSKPLVRAKFKITQDPADHPTVDKGVHTVMGGSIEECWANIDDLANVLCDDEFTINLIEVLDE